MAKQEKNNVMRILDQKKIPYESHTYDSAEAISGMEVVEIVNPRIRGFYCCDNIIYKKFNDKH